MKRISEKDDRMLKSRAGRKAMRKHHEGRQRKNHLLALLKFGSVPRRYVQSTSLSISSHVTRPPVAFSIFGQNRAGIGRRLFLS